LHRERASLEQVFRDLTSEDLGEEGSQLELSPEDPEIEGAS
jgi:hypothetical protein